jgi:D-alanine-D-alanine ligase
MALASAVSMNKILTKKVYLDHEIKTPLYTTVDRHQDVDVVAKRIFKSFPIPAVVKPANGGSSVGTSVAKNLKELISGIEQALGHSSVALVEEFISGVEATCGVVEDFRGEKYYSLLPIEIIPKKNQSFFNYEAKYSSVAGAEEICPGRFSHGVSREIQKLAIDSHRALGLRHYSRTDFIVNSKRGIYVLETNTLPGLTETSLLPKSIEAVGSSLPELFDHLIQLALKRPR